MDKQPLPDHCRSANCSCACIAASRHTFEKGYDARKLGALFDAIQNAKDDLRLGTGTIFDLRKIIRAFENLKMEL